MFGAEAARRALAQELPALTELRRALHRTPSLSDEEQPTAERLLAWLGEHAPARTVRGLGGAGIAAVYDGAEPGPTVLLRAELDALPIAEPGHLAHASQIPGVSHKCGHDGHMAILAGVAKLVSRSPPAKGRVVLLFQPAEETGTGARAVVQDPKFAEIAPDYAFALHNLPGYPKASIAVRAGAFAAASEGLEIWLAGASSHASEPHLGKSPALALSQLIPALLALPAQLLPMDTGAAVAITHANLGEPSFGIAAGKARVQTTMRSSETADLERLMTAAERAAEGLGAAHGLEVTHARHDRFGATANDDDGARIVREAAKACGLACEGLPGPFPWSEDFGEILGTCRGAMFGVGAGPSCAPLHNEEYDFPDDILESGVLTMTTAASLALADEWAGRTPRDLPRAP